MSGTARRDPLVPRDCYSQAPVPREQQLQSRVPGSLGLTVGSHRRAAQAEWRVPLGATAGGPDSQVTGLAYSLELEAVVVGLSTGELLVIHCATQQVRLLIAMSLL